MIGYILYETAEIITYGARFTINRIKETYDWLTNKEEDDFKIPDEILVKIKDEVKEELRKEFINAKSIEEGVMII